LMTSVAFTAIFCAISCGVMVSPMDTSRFTRRGGHFEGVFGLDADRSWWYVP
jgi:hypothetical protein